MTDAVADGLKSGFDRRRLLAAGGAGGLVLMSGALAGCTTMGGFSLTEVVRRLLLRSSERAFARLTGDGGFWDAQVGKVGLNSILGTRGDILSSILTSNVFKSQLQGAFADLAVDATERAAPIVANAVRVVGIDAAEQLVRGGPTAATGFLRGQMGSTLLEAMVPELGQAMRLANDPVIGQALARLTGADVSGIATRLSGTVEDAIWAEMGIEEAAIRADPASTNDPLLMGTFGLARAL